MKERPTSIPPDVWDKIIEARHSAARSALRLGAGNTVGLTHDDLRALAEDGLIAAGKVYDQHRRDRGIAAPVPGPVHESLAQADPERDVEFATLAYPYVRGKVLHALRRGRRLASHEILASTVSEERRTGDRALLDDLGAGIDTEAYDVWEDTEDDYRRRAQDLADDGMLALVLGRAIHSSPMAERHVLRSELLQQLDAEVASLPGASARLIRLRFYEDQTLDEIAKTTRTTLPTVHRKLGEVLSALRKRMPPLGKP